MERDRPPPPFVEVLEADRSPGFFESRVVPLLSGRRAQVALALAVALALVVAGGWWVASLDPRGAAQARGGDDVADAAGGQEGGPGDTRSGPDVAGPWRIDDGISITFTEQGRTVTFVAVNAGFVARNPRDLQVETSYPGGLASSYAFGCVGGRRTAQGFRPQRGLVDPGGRVLVQCPDTVRLNGQPGRLPPEVIDVVLRPRD